MLRDPTSVGENELPVEAGSSSLPERTPVFQQTDWLSFSATTTLALVVYLVTLAPDVTLGFSGIFSVGAMYGGVPHPPGYPLSTIYFWVFINLVPFSNIAWRVAAASALAGAVSCGLIALMVSRFGAELTEKLCEGGNLKAREKKWLRGASGYAAGLAFGFSGGFWGSAVIADVWTLDVLMLCTVLCLVMRWIWVPGHKRYLFAACLAYGLTVTNSQIMLTVAPALPVLIALQNRSIGRDLFATASLAFLAGFFAALTGRFPLLWDTTTKSGPLFALYLTLGLAATTTTVALAGTTRSLFTEWKTVLAGTGAFLSGLALYFYVPIASMMNPPMNWGYARTVSGFYHVLSRGQYERIHPTDSAARLLEQIFLYGEIMGTEFGWPYLLPALVSFALMRRMRQRERRWLLGLLVLYVCLTVLMISVLNPGAARESRAFMQVPFSASYVVLALWMGYGLTILGSFLSRRRTSGSTAALTA